MSSVKSLSIGPGTDVTLHFSLTLPDGNLIDSNFDKDPATFTVGDGKLLEGFEKAILGLKAGDEQSFIIEPKDAFGQSNPSNLYTLSLDMFDDSMELESGLVISFADAAGQERPGMVRQIEDGEVLVDFNHPLAGRDITFKVQILEVKPSVKH